MNWQGVFSKESYEGERSWRNGWSKRHRFVCEQCGGALHERGRHLSQEALQLLQIKQRAKKAR